MTREMPVVAPFELLYIEHCSFVRMKFYKIKNPFFGMVLVQHTHLHLQTQVDIESFFGLAVLREPSS